MNLGLVFKSGDPVLIGVFLCLIAMSIATWTIILLRSLKQISTKKANRTAKQAIWSSADLEAAEQQAKQIEAPISELFLDGLNANRRFNATQQDMLSASLPRNAYLERELRHSTGKILSQFDGGMIVLATVGSTAPFIGLLGTVWGIYHALINISKSGQMSIAEVSGPIGEALVATAVGLFVAIPAVLAYNFFMRSNKKLSRTIHNFAHDLHVQLINGKQADKE
ncbi:MotA/TolQ/ExbB proton channel family protein [Kingella negevensis]|uniref:Biopolymer transport protein ExbB n=1 Tax=Kingella negevensis TaxID=1522312 RepID=A0A238TBV9_9NEIS|nr:MotA/TolQ/ExbB proton channel family protein [Kingella negevensis]MDK4687817.1 MotA/TolQ/ExbB proton channel family protein [Kingella negevensis]WII91187.1 MotA/TolQ/ExbB proton channel family protein [Kingella negevensis]SNB75632.1 Biopolymer transport protein ExbB [Kingella negevensis]